MEYIQNHTREEVCAFCKALTQPDSPRNLIVYRGASVFLIINRYPYTSGHMMAVPYKHISSLGDLEVETRAEIIEVSNQAVKVLQQVYQPQGFNLGMNIGEAAGAGITEHIHLHIVPRWKGDTNFMSTLGDTRILPETLEETYRRVKEAWDSINKLD